MNPKRPTLRHIIIKMQKVKNKERILEAARERQLVTYVRLSDDFSTDFAGQNEVAINIQNEEKQGSTSKITQSNKVII